MDVIRYEARYDCEYGWSFEPDPPSYLEQRGVKHQHVCGANELFVTAADYDSLLRLNAAMQSVVNAASILEHAMSGTDDEAGDDEMYALFEAVEAYREQREKAK